jgi:hypothetical protein
MKQTVGICYKNMANNLSGKKKLLGELVMPLLISMIYIFVQGTDLSIKFRN